MDEQSYPAVAEAVSDEPEASAEDAPRCKLVSEMLSLIARAKDISKLGHVGCERRTHCAVAPNRHSVTNQPKSRDLMRIGDQRMPEA
jgi:hypothetical protein